VSKKRKRRGRAAAAAAAAHSEIIYYSACSVQYARALALARFAMEIVILLSLWLIPHSTLCIHKSCCEGNLSGNTNFTLCIMQPAAAPPNWMRMRRDAAHALFQTL